MYKIVAYDSPTEKTGRVIFDPRVNKLVSIGSKLTLKESDISDLQLVLNQNNSLFGNIKPFQTHIEVYDDNELIFRGRALKPKREMSSSAQLLQTASMESISAYLLDSTQRFLEVHNMTPANFFKKLIDVHNSQVPAYQRFTVGKVDVTNSTDNVYRFVDYTNTLDTINEKLVSRLGGYLQIRYENGINYIDYLKEVGTVHDDTPIKIGKNLKSSSVDIDPTAIITRLVPLGATIDRANNNQENTSNPRVDIKSVNGGKDYIDIPELQKEFGIINGAVFFDDVKEPKNVKTKGEQWIKDQKTAIESWSVAVVETDKKKYKVSDSYNFINPFVAEPQSLRVAQKEIDFQNWQSPALTIGEKKKTLSQYQSDFKKTKDSITQLQNSVKGQIDSIGNLTTETSALRTDIDAQKVLLDEVNSKVDDIDLTEVNTQISSLTTRITEVEGGLLGYQNSQKIINDDVESRLKVLEGK